MRQFKPKPDGPWFMYSDEVIDALASSREFTANHHRIINYIIGMTWRHKIGRKPAARGYFFLDRTEAADVTKLGTNFSKNYYALLHAGVIFEEDGFVGVENKTSLWKLDKLSEASERTVDGRPVWKKKQTREVVESTKMTDEVLVEPTKELVEPTKILVESTTAKQVEPAPDAGSQIVREGDHENNHEAKASCGEEKPKKAVGGKKPSPDKRYTPEIQETATRLYDLYKDKRGYRPSVKFEQILQMVASLLKAGYTAEQMVSCLTYLTMVDKWHMDPQHDWSVLRVKDKIGWYVKAVWKPEKPKDAPMTANDFLKMMKQQREG